MIRWPCCHHSQLRTNRSLVPRCPRAASQFGDPAGHASASETERRPLAPRGAQLGLNPWASTQLLLFADCRADTRPHAASAEPPPPPHPPTPPPDAHHGGIVLLQSRRPGHPTEESPVPESVLLPLKTLIEQLVVQ